MSVTEWTSRAEGHQTRVLSLVVSEGQNGGPTILLGESGIPIPEFASALPVVFMTFTVALTVLRSRRIRSRNGSRK